jgi:hypothetical protein
MTILALLLLVALVAVLASGWVGIDFRKIKENKPIVHWVAWCLRAGIVVFLAVAINRLVGNTWTSLLGLLMIGAAEFSALFRYRLNKLRRLDWRYIAPWSNTYDRVWYAIATLTWWSNAHLELHQIWLEDYRKSRIADPSKLHRAGTVAYSIEALAFIAGVVIVLT